MTTYEDIPGWFDFDDIYREQVAAAQDGARFVEVGSWLGRSTAFMGREILTSGKRIQFFAIDTWRGSPAAQYQDVVAKHGGSVYDEFLFNMAACGVDRVVRSRIQDSVKASESFADGMLDFVFLDAAHDFHSVRRDVAAWLPKVRVGGVLAGHDANCPGLMNAVRDLVPAAKITYPRASWHYVVPEYPLDLLCRGKRIGVWDTSLGTFGARDYARRACLMEVWTPSFLIGALHTTANIDADDLAKYTAKWGGPPGSETFTFPYNVTTLDW